MFGQIVLEPSVLASIVAIAVSLVFNYLPGLRVWFAGLQSQFKSLLMIGILFLISVVIWVLGGLNLLAVNIPFTWVGFAEVVKVFVATILANQGTYLLFPQTADVKFAKNIRDVVAGEVAPATPEIKREAAKIE
jgi:hypothetical protein